MFEFEYFGGVILLLVIALLFSMFRVLREYERGVIFMLGRFYKVKGPGLIIVIPVLQQMVRVDLRTVVMDVPTQDVISRDNVSVQVNAVIYFRVLDPEKAIIQVENFLEATSQLSQTTLRSVLGQHDLDDMLAERERLNADIQDILDKQTAAWGIKVANVEIKHVDLNETMVRAIAKQAEAERERRAKVIHAMGEYEAQDHKIGASLAGLIDAADDVVSACRPDRALQIHKPGVGPCLQCTHGAEHQRQPLADLFQSHALIIGNVTDLRCHHPKGHVSEISQHEKHSGDSTHERSAGQEHQYDSHRQYQRDQHVHQPSFRDRQGPHQRTDRQHKQDIEKVGPEHVANAKVSLTAHGGNDRGHQFWHAGAQGNYQQANNHRGHTQQTRKLCTIGNRQLAARKQADNTGANVPPVPPCRRGLCRDHSLLQALGTQYQRVLSTAQQIAQ
jgi:regulator of protease activity HflC (stomatin/prohibitin superfamily)